MANQSISQLPIASAPLTGNELSVIVQNGVTKQTSLQNVANLGGPTGPVGPVGPQGPTGPAATVQVQSTTTTAPGTNANVINIGSTTAAYLEFYIPRGDVGATGATGATGPVGPQGPQGVPGVGVPTGGTTGQILYKVSNTDFDTSWESVPTLGVASFQTSLSGLTPATATTGAITLAGTLGVASGGTGAVTLTGYLKGNGTSAITGSATIPTTDLSGTISNAQLANSSIAINGSPISLGGSVNVGSVTSVSGTGSVNGITLTGTVTSTGSLTLGGTLGGIDNSQLTNSAITINGNSVSLGGSTTVTANTTNALTIGTGLSGTTFNGSTPTTIALANTAVTPATYGSATQVPVIAVNAQGQITSATNTTITAGGLGAITAVNGTANQITTSQVGSVATVAIADNPILKGVVSVLGTGVTSFTPFTPALQAWQVDDNNYREVYVRNVNNGSDASSDFVAYNDASDTNSYFIDMGMNSSNFSSVSYPIFTPNSAYLFTGGGLTGQETDLFIGTSNANSDIVLFVGGVGTANKAVTIHGATGNLVLGTNADTGYQLNVTDSAYIQGVTLFGDSVTLHQDPTSAMQAATKQYVDAATSAGFTVHPSVVYATTAALAANTYNNGTLGVGATLTGNANGALVIDGHTFVSPTDVGVRVLIKNEATSANNGCYTVTQVGSLITPYILTRATDFDQAAAGEIANNAYFFVTAGSVNIGTSYILSQTAAITVGTTALPFTLFASALTYTGGTNIDVTGQIISLTGTVAATNGGTGTNTVTTGDLLYGSATDTWSKLAVGSAYKSLVVNASGTQVEWNAVALNQSAAVSGQLGTTNGGTGLSAFTSGGAVYATSTSVLTTGTLPVASGGTGAVTLTGYVKGNGTSAFTAASTIPTTDLSGTISNAQLANSTITLGSSTLTLGGTTTTVAGLTLTSPTIATILNTGTLTLPTATDTLVGRATTDTLTNKSISGSTNTLSDIGNASLTNSSVTINGNSVSLGGSTTVTAVNPNALTIGTGLTGTSYNGSAAVTVAIDSTVATLTGTQTLTNKTMSGASNTFSNIPNTAITGLGTMSTQDANSVAITGGTVSVSTVTATTGIFGGTF